MSGRRKISPGGSWGALCYCVQGLGGLSIQIDVNSLRSHNDSLNQAQSFNSESADVSYLCMSTAFSACVCVCVRFCTIRSSTAAFLSYPSLKFCVLLYTSSGLQLPKPGVESNLQLTQLEPLTSSAGKASGCPDHCRDLRSFVRRFTLKPR